ncbi:hypothetical protein QYS48_07855 [Marivirga arenosa]|uniref:Tail specific protease domain-containing protein n=1 Tax=Marivirga arenosa TaxID=3059076 RepID=A0AA49GLJ7_9BACT|nr:hypothetical protein [Marivirga sp. ABR2-2]WKK86795.2 hypothetical protein QYS48_07855 [Marivirga sp. ABR2-2]
MKQSIILRIELMDIRKLYNLGLLFILLTILIGCSEQKEIKSRKQQWLDDIAYFENVYLQESNTFPEDSLEKCQSILDQLKQQVESLDDNELILKFSRCVSMANNGHTVIPLHFMAKVPLRFYKFSDGVHIVKTDSASTPYLGAKVLKINDLTIEDVEEKLKPYLSGIDRWRSYKASNYLCSPEILHGIGLSEKNSMTLTLLKDKDTLKATFTTKEMKKKYYENWSDLYPDPADSGWHYALNPNIQKPLYLDKMQEGVFYHFIDSTKSAYFSINGYWNQADDFEDKIEDFLEVLETKTDYNVIMDLRYFTGGNYIIPVDLATKPPKIIDSNKKIYLITSNKTFSAGLVTAARIKYYAEEKIVIVGEEVGDNLKFWAENDSYQLPNSGINIYDSDAEHDWKDNEFTFGKSFWVNYFYGVPAKSLAVDQEIKLSFTEYMQGDDPILNWILNQPS